MNAGHFEQISDCWSPEEQPAGSAAGGGLAAVSAQVTNGNLYAFTKASRHCWCRFNRAWVDVGAMAPAEGTVATKVTLNPAHAKTPDNAVL